MDFAILLPPEKATGNRTSGPYYPDAISISRFCCSAGFGPAPGRMSMTTFGGRHPLPLRCPWSAHFLSRTFRPQRRTRTQMCKPSQIVSAACVIIRESRYPKATRRVALSGAKPTNNPIAQSRRWQRWWWTSLRSVLPTSSLGAPADVSW